MLTSSDHLQILWEDADFIAVNKPALLHSAIVKSSDKPSVAAWLIERDHGMSEASKKYEDAGLLNRLDYETSGVLLAAKSRTVWLKLRDLLKADEAQKTYLAILEGQAPSKQEVSNYLGSRHRHSKKVSIYAAPTDKRALPAQSTFELLEYFPTRNLSLVKVSLGSGRRHQVRAHAAGMNCPLLGDSLYGATRSVSELSDIGQGISLPGFLLHAETIAVRHPLSGEKLRLRAPIPSVFEYLTKSAP